MNDLQILVTQQQGVISTNFEEIKTALSDQMQVYKDLDVTEENKTERKKDIATLRKIIKAVSDKRIEVKKECLKPYDAFEKQANELIDIINEPVRLIDNQVKEYEDKQRLQKIESIKTIFCEVMEKYPDISNQVGLESFYDDKWENVATSLKSIKEEITAKSERINNEVTVIKSMVSDRQEYALMGYWTDFNLAKAVTTINTYEEQKRKIIAEQEEKRKRDDEAAVERERERIRREEREAIAKEERIKAEAEAKAKADQEAKEKAERDAMAIQKQATASLTYVMTYAISATKEEFEQIEMYMNSLGVDYQSI